MALSTAFFRALKYLPALLPDATTFPTLATNTTPQTLFSYGNLRSTGRLVTLRSLQFQQSATDVAAALLIAQADSYSTPSVPVASILPQIAVRPDRPWRLPAAANRLQALIANPGSQLTNFAVNWTVLVEEPSIATKLKFPRAFGVTASEQQLAAQAGLTGSTPRGVLPRTFEWVVHNEFETQVTDSAVIGQALPTLVPGTPVLMAQDSAHGDEALVIRSLYTTPGTGSDGLTMIVQADDNDDFLQIPAYGLGIALPVETFIIASQQVAIYAVSTSSTNNVAMSAEIWHVRLTPEIQYRLGQAVSPSVAQKLQVGVL